MEHRIQSVKLALASVILLIAQSVSAFYDPNLGRWINRDPIGVEGGVNLYTYVGNAPVQRKDAWGLVIVWEARTSSGELSEKFKKWWQNAIATLRKTSVGRRLLAEAEKPENRIVIIESDDRSSSGGGHRNLPEDRKPWKYEGEIMFFSGDNLGLDPEARKEFDAWPDELAPLDAKPKLGAAVVLGHELGHIFSIFNLNRDIELRKMRVPSGYDDPENVNLVENPIRRQLLGSAALRKTYHGQPLTSPEK